MGLGKFFTGLESIKIPGEEKVTNAEEAIKAIFERVNKTADYGGLWYKGSYVKWGFTQGQFTYSIDQSIQGKEKQDIKAVFDEVSRKLEDESSLEYLARTQVHGVHPADTYITPERLETSETGDWTQIYKIKGGPESAVFYGLSSARKYVLEHRGPDSTTN